MAEMIRDAYAACRVDEFCVMWEEVEEAFGPLSIEPPPETQTMHGLQSAVFLGGSPCRKAFSLLLGRSPTGSNATRVIVDIGNEHNAFCKSLIKTMFDGCSASEASRIVCSHAEPGNK